MLQRPPPKPLSPIPYPLNPILYGFASGKVTGSMPDRQGTLNTSPRTSVRTEAKRSKLYPEKWTGILERLDENPMFWTESMRL